MTMGGLISLILHVLLPRIHSCPTRDKKRHCSVTGMHDYLQRLVPAVAAVAEGASGIAIAVVAAAVAVATGVGVASAAAGEAAFVTVAVAVAGVTAGTFPTEALTLVPRRVTPRRAAVVVTQAIGHSVGGQQASRG